MAGNWNGEFAFEAQGTSLWVVPAGISAIVMMLGIALAAAPASAGHYGSVCDRTALLQYFACRHEVRDDFFIDKAKCLNLVSPAEHQACRGKAYSSFREEKRHCSAQRTARVDLCDAVGDGPYDPDFDPADFDSDFTNLTNPNPYFPLGIGNRWVFEGGDETTTIEVMNKTKDIKGVTCIVVNDVVAEDGEPIEDTDDWFGQRLDGTVDYCGESVQDFEIFENDSPPEPELVSREGSFKVGVEGDKQGTLFPGTPVVGETYRQEWSPSNAEDAATVLSTTYVYGSDAELDEFVPQEIAELFCTLAAPCVVTAEFSPIEPDAFERKYFGKDIGKFLEVNVEDGEIAELVSCNFDARCGDL